MECRPGPERLAHVFRDDWLHRQIQKLAEAIARVVDARSGSVEDQELAIEEAYDAILGEHRSFLGLVDAQTLASLLADEERLRALVELTALDAARQHEPTEAERLRARGKALLGALRQTADSEQQRLRALLELDS